MDISEILTLSKFFLPVAVSVLAFLAAKRVQHRRLRKSVKTFSSVLFCAGALVACVMLLVQAGCTKHAPPIYSPDQRHVAIERYALQAALGDYAIVRLRSRWSPWV